MLKEIFFKVGNTLTKLIIQNTIILILLIIIVPLYLLNLYRIWKR